MDKKNENGFTILVDKKPQKEPEKKQKKEVAKYQKFRMTGEKPDFKKGSVRWELFRRIKKTAISTRVEDFVDTRRELRCIYTESDQDKIIRLRKSIGRKKLDKLSQIKNSIVSIGYGMGRYQDVSVKTYRKLLGIRRVAIQNKFSIQFDGENHWEELFTLGYLLDSMNDLIRFNNELTIQIDTIIRMHEILYNYDMYRVKFKILVYMENGDCYYYKDVNEFFKDFGLRLV